MEKYFCNYNQSLALKELGFNEICFATFDSDKWFDIQDFGQNYDTFPSHIIAAPLKSQVFDWFRREHKLDGWAVPCYTSEGKFYSFIIENGEESTEINSFYDDFQKHEEAESACIDKLIEIVKNK